MKNNNIENIKNELDSLMNELGIEAELKVSLGEKTEEEETVDIQIESPEAASLIGFHGETMHALQLISSFLCHKQLDKWVRVVVNIGDYRQKREEQLKNLALSLAMRAKFSKETQIVPNLNSSERRFVHMFLADNPDVYSESEGEGRNRVLTIKPKV